MISVKGPTDHVHMWCTINRIPNILWQTTFKNVAMMARPNIIAQYCNLSIRLTLLTEHRLNRFSHSFPNGLVRLRQFKWKQRAWTNTSTSVLSQSCQGLITGTFIGRSDFIMVVACTCTTYDGSHSPGQPENTVKGGTTVSGGSTVLSKILQQSLRTQRRP